MHPHGYGAIPVTTFLIMPLCFSGTLRSDTIAQIRLLSWWAPSWTWEMIRTLLKGYVIRNWPPSPILKAWPWLGRLVSLMSRQMSAALNFVRGWGTVYSARTGVVELELSFPRVGKVPWMLCPDTAGLEDGVWWSHPGCALPTACEEAWQKVYHVLRAVA